MGNRIKVYGVFFTEEELKERSTWHETTYIEREIPQKLEKELNKITDKKVNEFEKKCGCGRCKLHT